MRTTLFNTTASDEWNYSFQLPNQKTVGWKPELGKRVSVDIQGQQSSILVPNVASGCVVVLDNS